MDVYLVDPATNAIYNCVVIMSLEYARELYPYFNCYERTASNAYLNIGDQYHD
jgi:hypothetical protein